MMLVKKQKQPFGAMRRPFETLLLPAAILLLVLLSPEIAQAQTKSSIADVLCTVGSWLWGDLGKLIGMLGIIVLGLASMFGRMQIGTVLTTLAGIAIIFGAQKVVQALGLPYTCDNASISKAADILSSPIYTMFACLTGWFMGPIGKSLATIAIITLGVFAIYGRISYHQALVVATGIAAMFGAAGIINSLGIGAVSIPTGIACGSTTSPIENVYCSLIKWFNGPMGKGVGTVGIIIVGIGALYGKVSWGIAIVAGVGAALIFGGTTIVSALGGPGDMACAAGSYGELMSITIMFCNIINWFNGPIGKGVATLAVIIMGLGALFGKISWIMAIVTGVGVALIFGATTILSALGGSGDLLCTVGFLDGTKPG
jgi:type IV secretory pathway VirB2 component (pilin)